MTLAGVVAILMIASGNNPITTDGIADLVCAVALWGTGFITWRRIRMAIAGASTRHAAT